MTRLLTTVPSALFLALIVMAASSLGMVNPVAATCPQNESARRHLLVVVGAEGESPYGEMFDAWATRWKSIAQRADVVHVQVGPAPRDTDSVLGDLQEAMNTLSQSEVRELWVILIGHGTFDGQQSKFNLRGPDVSDAKLNTGLSAIDAPTVVVNCSSASGEFIGALKHPKRVVVTATKSGFQYNFSRFGEYFTLAIEEGSIDLDKDEQTSLLEAFLVAGKRTEEFYQSQSRLATEHALIDDNGDGRGTPVDFFEGVRVSATATDGTAPDGLRANQWVLLPNPAAWQPTDAQRQRRDELEAKLEALRLRKTEMLEPAYFRELESVLVPLARLYGESKTGKQR